MKRYMLAVAVLGLAACASSGPMGSAPQTSALQAQLKVAQDEAALTKLKLADEMERADVQNYLRQQEVVAAKRETAAMKAKCGAPCATP
jgi:uncharacterized lipoprotein YmbA